jgi:hypothetical protein
LAHVRVLQKQRLGNEPFSFQLWKTKWTGWLGRSYYITIGKIFINEEYLQEKEGACGFMEG